MVKKYEKKRLIQIRSRRKGWVTVELLSINKGGTITIKTITGEVIVRKWNKTRLCRSRKYFSEEPNTNVEYPKIGKVRKHPKKKKRRDDLPFSKEMNASWDKNLKKLESSKLKK